MRRTGRAVGVAALALGLFAAGGVGLLHISTSPTHEAQAPPPQADRLGVSPLLPAG